MDQITVKNKSESINAYKQCYLDSCKRKYVISCAFNLYIYFKAEIVKKLNLKKYVYILKYVKILIKIYVVSL